MTRAARWLTRTGEHCVRILVDASHGRSCSSNRCKMFANETMDTRQLQIFLAAWYWSQTILNPPTNRKLEIYSHMLLRSVLVRWSSDTAERFLPCGHLDLESGYCTKWRIQGSFDRSYSLLQTSKPSQETQHLASIRSDTFNSELHVHDDERWPMEVTSNTYLRWPMEVTSNTYFRGVVRFPRPSVVGRFLPREETPTVFPSDPAYLLWALHQLGPTSDQPKIV